MPLFVILMCSCSPKPMFSELTFEDVYRHIRGNPTAAHRTFDTIRAFYRDTHLQQDWSKFVQDICHWAGGNDSTVVARDAEQDHILLICFFADHKEPAAEQKLQVLIVGIEADDSSKKVNLGHWLRGQRIEGETLESAWQRVGGRLSFRSWLDRSEVVATVRAK